MNGKEKDIAWSVREKIVVGVEVVQVVIEVNDLIIDAPDHLEFGNGKESRGVVVRVTVERDEAVQGTTMNGAAKEIAVIVVKKRRNENGRGQETEIVRNGNETNATRSVIIAKERNANPISVAVTSKSKRNLSMVSVIVCCINCGRLKQMTIKAND